MKHCVNCEYSDYSPVQSPNGQTQMAYICQHKECTEPVDGSALLCGIARRQAEFCGLGGKHWMKKKEPEKAPLLEIVKP